MYKKIIYKLFICCLIIFIIGGLNSKALSQESTVPEHILLIKDNIAILTKKYKKNLEQRANPQIWLKHNRIFNLENKKYIEKFQNNLLILKTFGPDVKYVLPEINEFISVVQSYNQYTHHQLDNNLLTDIFLCAGAAALPYLDKPHLEYKCKKIRADMGRMYWEASSSYINAFLDEVYNARKERGLTTKVINKYKFNVLLELHKKDMLKQYSGITNILNEMFAVIEEMQKTFNLKKKHSLKEKVGIGIEETEDFSQLVEIFIQYIPSKDNKLNKKVYDFVSKNLDNYISTEFWGREEISNTLKIINVFGHKFYTLVPKLKILKAKASISDSDLEIVIDDVINNCNLENEN